MTATQRREQLVDVARAIFAEKGLDGTTVEEIAYRAEVSKPVVYEHFGGKDALYAEVVRREVDRLMGMMEAVGVGASRAVLEQTVHTLLDYVEENPDGFHILVRDRPIGSAPGTHQNVLGEVGSRLGALLAEVFEERGFDVGAVPLYTQMLIGMGMQTCVWWLDTRAFDKRTVATHLVNLVWRGLSRLDTSPTLVTDA